MPQFCHQGARHCLCCFCNSLCSVMTLIDHRSYEHNLSSCEIKARKKLRPERDSNPWPLRCRCSSLPTELSSQLGAGHVLCSIVFSYQWYEAVLGQYSVHVRNLSESSSSDFVCVKSKISCLADQMFLGPQRNSCLGLLTYRARKSHFMIAMFTTVPELQFGWFLSLSPEFVS